MAEVATTPQQSSGSAERQSVQALWRQENAAFRARVRGQAQTRQERRPV